MDKNNRHNKEVQKNHQSVDLQEKDKVPPLIIPESQGDLADRAQDQIDADIQSQINNIRRNIKRS